MPSTYTPYVGVALTSSGRKVILSRKKSKFFLKSTNFDLIVLKEEWMDFRLNYISLKLIWPLAYDSNTTSWVQPMPRVENSRHLRDT